MIRTFDGWRVTGVEATLCQLAASLDEESFEIACEDARRRGLTSVPALRAYVDRFGGKGRHGCDALRRLLDQLDPAHPSRSALEVKTRRLLHGAGLPTFEREIPLTWNGVTRYFDFGRVDDRLAIECQSRRWHDDASDYDREMDKLSIPGRLGWTIVFVTWSKVENQPDELIAEVRDALRNAPRR